MLVVLRRSLRLKISNSCVSVGDRKHEIDSPSHPSGARREDLFTCLLREPPRRASSRCNADTNEYSTKRCSLEYALVLLDLQSCGVGLTFDAEESRASYGKPGAKEDLVAVLFQRRFRGNGRHSMKLLTNLIGKTGRVQ